MIGLAKKAGRVEIGEEPVGSAARAKHARVILVAQDAAASSVRRAYSFAQSGACLCLTIDATKDELGSALGRTSCAMAAITEPGMALSFATALGTLPEADLQLLQQRAEKQAKLREEAKIHKKNLKYGKK